MGSLAQLDDEKTIAIEWRNYSNKIKARYYAKQQGKSIHEKNPVRFGEHVRLTRSGTYSVTCFKTAPDWEKELIMEFEAEFKKKRAQSAQAAFSAKHIRKLIKLLKEEGEGK